MDQPGFRLLHITDLHFGNSAFWSPANQEESAEYTTDFGKAIARRHFRELHSALAAAGTPPPFNAVILSGDFTDKCSKYGFEIAKYWIEMLVEHAYAEPEHFLLVPGNHDVNLGKTDPGSKTPLPWPRALAEKNYKEFLNSLGDPFSKYNDYLSVAARVTTPKMNSGLILVGLNSCRTERLESKGWGHVGVDQLQTVLSRIQSGSLGFAASPNDILLAFTHHHPLPLWDVGLDQLDKAANTRKLSFLMDSPTLLKALTGFGFAGVLHGHAHRRRTVRIEGCDPRPQRFRNSLVVSGQGSFGANSEDCLEHHFSVIDIYGFDGQRSDLRLRPTQFESKRVAVGKDRVWEENSNHQIDWVCTESGWSVRNCDEISYLFRDEACLHLERWRCTDSWALLHERPHKAESRRESAEWRAILETLAGEVSQMLKRPIEVQAVEQIIDRIFEHKQDPGDVSGTFLQQYIAWKLRNVR